MAEECRAGLVRRRDRPGRTLALHDELALAPKPGLVSFADSGSHDDMDAHTFMRSLFALRGYFVRIAELGTRHAPFEALERCGMDAESRMLAATGGVNTHRGRDLHAGSAVRRGGRGPGRRRALGGRDAARRPATPLGRRAERSGVPGRLA